MKKTSILFAFVILLFVSSNAQTGLNFQGVARSENNVILASQAISLKLSIIQGTANGTVEYTEIRKTTTNAQGLFNVVIGDANATSTVGNFSAINWSLTPKFLKIEMDPAAGDNFSVIGTTQLQSAAYAKYAESVEATNINGIVPVSKGGTGTTTGVTKTMVGLGNVDNTSDLNKPISVATQAAMDLKASKTYVDSLSFEGTPDATDTTKGKIQLAGALTGSADRPAIANNAIGTDQIIDASVTDAKVVNIAGAKIIGNIDGNASNITGVVTITNGGTGANNVNDARANLGLTIGVNVESPLTVTGPITRVNNAIGIPVASSGVNGYLSSTDWSNFNAKINASEKGANNGVASLGADGKIPSVQIPAISFQSANVVASQSAMLALSNAVEGSIAIRTDNNKNYVLSTTPASTLNNWIELATPTAVTSVNGFAGPNVTLTSDNIAEGATNKYFSNTQARNAISVTAPLTYDASTGGIAMPRASMNQAGYLDYSDWITFNSKMGTASATATFVPYTGATGPVNLGNYDLTVNGITVGRGKGGSSINSAFGLNTLGSNTTGNANSAFGVNAMLSNTIGSQNAAFGASALNSNTTGIQNSAFGTSSLFFNTSGFSNAAFGFTALLSNSTGSNNAVFGSSAMFYNSIGSRNASFGSLSMYNNTTGSQNAAFGYSALNSNTTGSLNAAFGVYSMSKNTTGMENAAFGNNSLSNNTTGRNNTSIGSYSLRNNTIGANNTAVGYALAGNTTGNWNTGLGANAVLNNTIGEMNTGIGASALFNNTTGSYNTAIGNRADVASADLTNATAIGNGATVTESYSMQLGDANLRKIKSAAKLTTGAVTYPNTDGTDGQVLTTNGQGVLSWTAASTNLSTMTGVANISNGGTGANNAVDARTNLGLTIGTDVEFPLKVVAPLIKNVDKISLPAASFSSSGYLSASDWVDFKIKISSTEKGANNGVATLDANGKIPSTQIPAISFQSANVVSSENAMLNLSGALVGSIAIRTDNSKNYVLSATPASTLANWIELATPNTVATVNGIAGPNVSLTTDNITEGSTNKYYTNAQARNAISVLAPLTYDASAGTISITTANANQSGYLNNADWTTFNSKMGTASATATFVPYNNATGPVNLGSYDLTVNGITVGKGGNSTPRNVAVGWMALAANTNGNQNTALGDAALYRNTIGANNTASGYSALYVNTTGSNNTALGSMTFSANTSGGNNSGVGYQALNNNTTGSYNTTLGVAGLYTNTTGHDNISMGVSALYNSNGNYNTAIGNLALNTNTIGNNNTALGFGADVASNNLTNATAIGNGAIVNADNTIQLGNSSITDVKTIGKLTTGAVTYPNIDGSNGQVLTTTGSGTMSWTSITGISSQTSTTTSLTAPFDLTLETGLNGSAIDIRTAENLANGSGSLASNTDGIANVAVGIRTLKSNTTGAANTAVGYEVLYSNTEGQNNTGVGTYALRSNTTGKYNTAVGSTALLSNTTGINNTSFGEWSLLNNISGYHNTAHGANTIMKNTTGNSNTGIGVNALFNSIDGNRNTAVGEGALFTLTNGSNNTTLGYAADVATNNLTNATAIGYYAQVTASNSIQLGNGDVTDVKTAGKLTTGAVTYPKTHGTNGQVLSTIGSGTLTWTTLGSNFVDVSTDQTIAGNKSFSSGLLSVGLSNRGGATSSIAFPHVDDPAFIGHYAVNNVGKMRFSAGDDATGDYFAFGYGLQNSFTEGLKIFANGQLTTPVDANINGLAIGMGNNNLYGNTALGNTALATITSGQYNTGLGNQALKFNTSGAANTAIGNEVMASNTTGHRNVAIGSSTLIANTSGVENTVVGTSAMYVNTTGSGNAAIGYHALNANTTGSENIAIGIDALTSNVAGSGMVAIGNGAMRNANNASSLGMTYNTAVGYNSLAGSNAPTANTGINNNALGSLGLFHNSSGSNNNVIGTSALYNNTTGSANIAIGTNSLYNNTTGTNNTVIGYGAGAGISTGSNNTIIGANVTGLTNISNNIIVANGNGSIKAQHDGTNWSLTGGVAIGSASPNTSAALEVKSTTKGFLPPRMTITQRDAISSPSEGLVIFNTDTKGIEYYTGTYWASTAPHYIGESYGGGIIFYLYDNGQHGLIAAASDQATDVRWYAGSNSNTMAKADGIGAGQKNTTIIISNQGYGDGATYAARLCNEYNVVADGVTYGDWYLPSKYELNLLRNAKDVLGNFAGFFYWSSTEVDNGTAWGQYFDLTTTQSPGDKFSSNTNHVRAIRKF